MFCLDNQGLSPTRTGLKSQWLCGVGKHFIDLKTMRQGRSQMTKTHRIWSKWQWRSRWQKPRLWAWTPGSRISPLCSLNWKFWKSGREHYQQLSVNVNQEVRVNSISNHLLELLLLPCLPLLFSLHFPITLRKAFLNIK